MMRVLPLLLVLLASPLRAQETLTLATPETLAIATTYQVVGLFVDSKAPNIEVTLESETGARFVWRYVVTEAITADEIRNAIRFINRGDFRAQGKTLNQWVLEQLVERKIKPGIVTVPQ